MLRVLEQLCPEHRMGKLDLFSLKKRRVQRYLSAAFQCLEGIQESWRLLIQAWSDRRRGSGFKLTRQI